MMSSMDIDSRSLCSALANYGISPPDCAVVLGKTLDETDPILNTVFDSLRHAIKACVIKGLNNGFTRDIASSINALYDMMHTIVSKQQSIVVDNKVKKVQKQADKLLSSAALREIAAKPLADVMALCSCGHAQRVQMYIQDTMACVRFLYGEVETLGPDEYTRLQQQADLGNMPIDAWRTQSLDSLQDALVDLDNMAELCAKVLDNSSATAYKSATEIVRMLMQWRTKLAYAYLTFDPAIESILATAQVKTCQWRLRMVGVTPTNPREAHTVPFPDDVLGEYVRRYNAGHRQ